MGEGEGERKGKGRQGRGEETHLRVVVTGHLSSPCKGQRAFWPATALRLLGKGAGDPLPCREEGRGGEERGRIWGTERGGGRGKKEKVLGKGLGECIGRRGEKQGESDREKRGEEEDGDMEREIEQRKKVIGKREKGKEKRREGEQE